MPFLLGCLHSLKCMKVHCKQIQLEVSNIYILLNIAICSSFPKLFWVLPSYLELLMLSIMIKEKCFGILVTYKVIFLTFQLDYLVCGCSRGCTKPERHYTGMEKLVNILIFILSFSWCLEAIRNNAVKQLKSVPWTTFWSNIAEYCFISRSQLI